MKFAEKLFQELKNEPKANADNSIGILNSALQIGLLDRIQYLIILEWLRSNR